MHSAIPWLSPPMRVAYLAAAATLVHVLERLWPLVPGGLRPHRRGVNLAHWLQVVLVNLALAVPAAAAIGWAEAHGIGLARRLSLAPAATAALALVGLDWLAWALHVTLHKSPLLWRIHRVHHNDLEIDVTTALRQHPLETLFRVTVQIAGSVALGLPDWALAAHVAASGVHAAFEHGNLRLPGGLDRAMRLLLVTPAMHRVHHSRRVAETDSNYANVFAFWDRLGGTYREVAAAAAIPIGLDGLDDDRAQSLLGLATLPFRPGTR